MPRPVKTAMSANELIVMLDGQQVGYCNSVTGTDDYNPEKLSGIGDIHVHEHVPTRADYTIAIERMTLWKSSLLSIAGDAWEDGYKMMQGLVFDIEMTRGTFRNPNASANAPGPGSGGATSTDGTGGSPKKWFQASFANGNIRFTKHAVVVEDATFFATQVTGDHTGGGGQGTAFSGQGSGLGG